MRLIMLYMACEMQVTDETKSEVILDSLDQILSMAKSSNQSQLIVKQIQEQDFLLEYMLNSLLFLIQNRRKSLKVLALQVTSSLVSQAASKPSLSCFLSNLLEVPICYLLFQQVLFKIMGTEAEEVVLTAISCITEVFTKDPYLVIKAYENGFDFQFLV